ncbi:copper chaperone PCu(A)C [Novosphingobium album (ex Liu et al. 2023)]|uniref:Copper chaperone PCu(A)C n=1 Tax=Novosphingobium album (ex Liu et al. 2023) TaxID=3031130 RepID=A0ABT5WPX7_9SPHN|nr:copper chaperone PCu(A)C [Novosphingobium album (ex Liu et al. 2023)]MDE8651929.1 copper chaperone PCu(A)C [Novosphingobium album (ex Liu et al. 2023)]
MKKLRQPGFAPSIALAIALAIPLGACQQASEPAATGADASEAAPDAKPGMAASRGELILPAIPGRPGAAYFEVRNDSGKPTALVAVHIDGVGKTEMHQTQGGTMAPVDKVDIAPGETIEFAQGGLHVMAFDIADTLEKGGTSEITLTFAGGDKLSMPIKIEAMGDDDAMGGMAHGEQH